HEIFLSSLLFLLLLPFPNEGKTRQTHSGRLNLAPDAPQLRPSPEFKTLPHLPRAKTRYYGEAGAPHLGIGRTC
ncbi:hypothetical protein B0H19DRAFT_525225, partial [Mycena capillaripes]